MERQRKHWNNSMEIIIEEEDLAVLINKAEIPEESSVKEHCIYRVPQKVRRINAAAYTPRVVSIGPYHNGDETLKLMNPLKLGYLRSFLKRPWLTLENCLSQLKECEPSIRNCYAESIPLKGDDFLKMILIDAGFIIEHFLRYYWARDWREKDPLLLKPWLVDDVFHDLILLENQLPFFVLEALFNLVTADRETAHWPTFRHLAFKYFERLNPQKLQPDNVTSVRHFTDLLRIFYLPPTERLAGRSKVGDILEHMYSARKLAEAGLKFKVDTSKKCLLELQYKRGVLTMPRLIISDKTEIYMRNIVAFEQGHYPYDTYITDYLKILDFLVDTDTDVEVLVHKGIITTLLGDNNEVATMINRLCSNLVQPNMNSEYLRIGKKLNEFCKWHPNKWKAGLKHHYFNTPMKCATSIAATLLLILTAIQTVCTVIPLAK